MPPTRPANDTWIAPTPTELIYRACVAAGFEPRIAYQTADPLAIRALLTSGLAVTLTPRLLAPHLEGVATPALAGAPARRLVYAVTPPTGLHPLVAPLLDVLRAESDAVGPPLRSVHGGSTE